jgi:hypothetical protein
MLFPMLYELLYFATSGSLDEYFVRHISLLCSDSWFFRRFFGTFPTPAFISSCIGWWHLDILVLVLESEKYKCLLNLTNAKHDLNQVISMWDELYSFIQFTRVKTEKNIYTCHWFHFIHCKLLHFWLVFHTFASFWGPWQRPTTNSSVSFII